MTTIRLSQPLKQGDSLVEEVRLRRPRVKHFVGAQQKGTPAAQELTLLLTLIEPAFTEAELLEMDIADYRKIQAALAGLIQ